jgi:hypothetical protein
MTSKARFFCSVLLALLLLIPASSAWAVNRSSGKKIPKAIYPAKPREAPASAAQETFQRFPAYAFSGPSDANLSFGSGCVANPSAQWVSIYLDPHFFQGQHITGFSLEFDDSDTVYPVTAELVRRQVGTITQTSPTKVEFVPAYTSPGITEYRSAADLTIDMLAYDHYLQIVLPPAGHDLKFCSVGVYFDKPLGLVTALPLIER